MGTGVSPGERQAGETGDTVGCSPSDAPSVRDARIATDEGAEVSESSATLHGASTGELERHRRSAVPPEPAPDPSTAPAAGRVTQQLRLRMQGPWFAVAGVVVWNLVNLRAETLAVPYLDDSSVHEQMVRFATLQLESGHFPLTTWFPYLGLGSPQFLHYQSLPAMLTGLVGIIVGPDPAYRWSLYLLLCAWPLSIYLAARLFGISRWGAAAAAGLSPFLMSATGVGYEQKAYLWIGYGVWTQLWASMTLPLAWALSWRAIHKGRSFLPAVVAVALTIALHFETGYLALLPLLLWPLVSWKATRRRVARAALITAGALLASAWVIVPLIAERSYAATNEILHETPLVNGYGAERVLSWLVTGQLLDAGRLPVVTVLAGIGVARAVARWRGDELGRALVVAFAGCLVLSFGRTTFGSLVDAVPGHGDIFFRRFMMGAQLASLFLAGVGLAWCARLAWRGLHDLLARLVARPPFRLSLGLACSITVVVAGLAFLSPAWTQLLAFDRSNSAAIGTQRAYDRLLGGQLDRLIAVVKREGGGRVYAGMPSNWGMTFRVGAVPVFKYLESRDVDEVGYTLRTASLMTDPEFYFDERDLSDYRLFGIRYLILPPAHVPPVPAHLVLCTGSYCLWTLPSDDYVQAGRLVGVLGADRTNVGTRSIPVLRSALAQGQSYVRLSLGASPQRAASARPAPDLRPASIGEVLTQESDLARGSAGASLHMERAGIVVLSASFDPGWTVHVDGRPAKVFSVAPALVAIRVPAGIHSVTFQYVGFSGYLVLFLLGGLSVAALAILDRKRRSGAIIGAGTRLRPNPPVEGNEVVGCTDRLVDPGSGAE